MELLGIHDKRRNGGNEAKAEWSGFLGKEEGPPPPLKPEREGGRCGQEVTALGVREASRESGGSRCSTRAQEGHCRTDEGAHLLRYMRKAPQFLH